MSFDLTPVIWIYCKLDWLTAFYFMEDTKVKQQLLIINQQLLVINVKKLQLIHNVNGDR